MKKVRIIVAGGRDFNNYDLLCSSLTDLLSKLDDDLQIEFVSGTCRGADVLGERFAESCGYKIKKFPANWEGFWKACWMG